MCVRQIAHKLTRRSQLFAFLKCDPIYEGLQCRLDLLIIAVIRCLTHELEKGRRKMTNRDLGGKDDISETGRIRQLVQGQNSAIAGASDIANEGAADGIRRKNDRGRVLNDSDLANLNSVLGHQMAENTKRTYETQWRRFVRWAASKGVNPLPAEPTHVAVYLAERLEGEGHKPATLRAAAAAVSYAHRDANYEDPCASAEVKDALKSAARKAGRNQRQAEALTADALQLIRATALIPRVARGGKMETQETAIIRGIADIAVISLMRDAMLRVSEAASLTWEDLTTVPDGTGRLLLRRSKTDAEGESVVLFVSRPTMDDLGSLRQIASERASIFGLSRDQISRRIKRAAREAGLGDGFSGHSPRVGMAQDLARAGTELPRLMTAGRWRSPRMPALYIRNETAARGAVAQYYGAASESRPTQSGRIGRDAENRRKSHSERLRENLDSGSINSCAKIETEHGKDADNGVIRRVTAIISGTESASKSRSEKARINGESAAAGVTRDFATQPDRNPSADFRIGFVGDLLHFASEVVGAIKNRPILTYLLLRSLPLAGCIVLIGYSLSPLDWNASWVPAMYVCIITGIVLAHALLFSDRNAELREFFWVSLFFMTSAPLLQFAPIQMDHYSLYRVGDFYGAHLPYMFALLINLVLAASGGLMFHVLNKHLPTTYADGYTPLRRAMTTVLPPLGMVYAVVVVISNASIWIQLAVMVPAVAGAFTIMLVLRDPSTNTSRSDRRFLLTMLSVTAMVASVLGVLTIMFIYASPDRPQVLPDHNLLRSWEIDFSQMDFTREEALDRLNLGYMLHATFAFGYLGFVLGGNLLVTVYRIGGGKATRPDKSVLAAEAVGAAQPSTRQERGQNRKNGFSHSSKPLGVAAIAES